MSINNISSLNKVARCCHFEVHMHSKYVYIPIIAPIKQYQH